MRAKVVTPVQDPTYWVDSLVITEKKNGALRVRLDPRELNKAIKWQHFSIPTPDDVRCKLAGKSIFTILDENDGYWEVKLDEPSFMLCIFSTPGGRYHFLRLPFGIKSASEVFQQKNNTDFWRHWGGAYHSWWFDYCGIIRARTWWDFTSNDWESKKSNVKFSKDKLHKVHTVKYMGHLITSEGVKPDGDKVEAIIKMPPPENKKAL